MKKILNSNFVRYISIVLAVIAATVCIVAAIGTIQAISMELYDSGYDEVIENGQKNLLNLYSRQIFASKDTEPDFMEDSNMEYIIIKGLDAGEKIFEGKNLGKLKNKDNYIYASSQSIIDDLLNGANENDFLGIQTYYKHEEDKWNYYDANINVFRSLNNGGHQDCAMSEYTNKTENIKRVYYDSNRNIFCFETDSYKFNIQSIKVKINDLDEDTRNMLINDAYIYPSDAGKYEDRSGNQVEFLKFDIEMWENEVRYYYDDYYDDVKLDLSKYKEWNSFYINDFQVEPEEISTVYRDLPYYGKNSNGDYTLYFSSDIKNYYIQNEAITVSYDIKDGLEECFVVLSNVKNDLDVYADDLFVSQKRLITFLYNIRNAMPIMMVVSGIIFLILFAFCCYSRYSCSISDTDSEKVKKSIIHRVPLAIYLIFMVCLITIDICMGAALFREVLFSVISVNSFFIVLSLHIIFIIIAIYLAILIFMEISCRLGAGILIKSTVCYYLIILAIKILKGLKKFTKKCIEKIKGLYSYISENTSFTKKMIIMLILFDIAALILISFIIGTGAYFLMVIAGIAFNILVIVVGLWLSMLQNQAKQLAEGDLNYKVDTSKMFWELKRHGDYLNRIGGAISLAVNDRMKSEHFKTELITNVSHDIKTPLTSIINYVDLLDRENISQPKAVEYIEVLKRQSAKLKKLIEDLMEASKASTGNIDMHLEPCNINILFTQMIGEYEEKLEAAGMEPIVESGDKDVYIMADNRHLWRIFDNILNNICKYGQTGTRVYINLEATEELKVNIIFRNISKYRLNISKDELLERFVRGDGSRHTEGNGLGLSIAQNLAMLMNGKLDIDVDGDLFKVILTFPIKI